MYFSGYKVISDIGRTPDQFKLFEFQIIEVVINIIPDLRLVTL